MKKRNRPVYQETEELRKAHDLEMERTQHAFFSFLFKDYHLQSPSYMV